MHGRLAAKLVCGFLLILTMTRQVLLASQIQVPSRDDHSLDYEGELRFRYYHAFQKGESSAQNDSNKKAPTYPTIGLTRAAFRLWWGLFDESSLSLGLRPDAYPRERGLMRDYDSRIGVSYRPEPTISLLDTYQIDALFGPDFKASLGVWDGLEIRRWESLNQFGLLVKFPDKFSGLRLFWQKQWGQNDDNINLIYNHFAEFYVYHGRQDRDDMWGENKTGADQSPRTSNPYLGAAVVGGLDMFNNAEMAFLLGQEKRKLVSGINVDEMYGQLCFSQTFFLGPYPLRITFDGRYDSEKFGGSQLNLPSLLQTSFSWLNSFALNERSHIVLAAHVGKSERATADDKGVVLYDGHQWDLGYSYRRGALGFSILVSQERRSYADQTGVRQEGFQEGSKPFSQYRRIGFEINYQLQGTGLQREPRQTGRSG